MSKVRNSKWRWGRFSVVFVVVLLLGVVAASSPAAAFWWWWDDPEPEAPGDEPVLLVHGFADSSDSIWWDVLENNLEDAGYEDDDIYRLDLGALLTTVDSPKEYAKEVCNKLEAIRLNEGLSEVDVIAHSMGGLDSRWCIEEMGGAVHVDDLVTLGTPHQGTTAAYLGYFTEGGRAMVPGSSFLTTLNRDGVAQGVEYTAVYGTWDEAVNPDENAKIPSSVLGDVEGRNIKAGPYTHLSLIWHEEVFNDYKHHLD
ncbi:MAG: alpha/beta fold hydrolase [Halobacteria archaeon]|nr:alpha/beta fold hydrolase [Halobacteria archaeon]